MRRNLIRLALLLGLAGAPLSSLESQRTTRPTTIGLALSGGNAKGIAHLGVLRVLERLGVRVDVVSGTSAGSVVGALYAMGLSVDSIQSVIASADWTALISDGVPRERRFLDQRRLDERPILTVPLEATRITLPTGAILGSNLVRLLEQVTWGAAMVRRFSELPRPFVAVATDLETGEAVALEEGVLAEALRASSGIPGAVEPIELDGRLLVDGGLSRNLPAVDALGLGADFLICSDVTDPLESAEELESLVDVLMQLASFRTFGATLEQRELCDVLILPDIEGISSLSFDQVGEWTQRGVSAAMSHRTELERVAQGGSVGVGRDGLAADSVRIASIRVEGSRDPRVLELVTHELDLTPGAYVGKGELGARLGDVDATGLFGLARYRLDQALDGAALTVTVEERPRNRLGVGLRYDEDRSAALLFTGTVRNLLLYGSETRLDLRVGEETQIGASFRRRRGVTGSLRLGIGAGWSQAPLQLTAAEGGRVDVDLTTATLFLGFGPGRATSVGVEAMGELSESSAGGGTVELFSVSAVLDHETLDRIDFPRAGADVVGRLEVGGTDIAAGESFSVATLDARYYLQLLGRLTADVGGFIGHAAGADLPPHRRLYLGGAHPSAVFGRTQPVFPGLGSQEESGLSAQVASVGLRWEPRSRVFLRGGIDVGAVRDTWQLPIERPMAGWSVSAGWGSLIGPVVLQLSKVWGDRDARLSLGVGRQF